MQRFFSRCLAGLICGTLFVSSASAQNAAQLAQQMRNTGKPALIIAGHETCVYCRQMSQELASNQEIQPLARQFFVIKVDIESKDWPILQQAFQFQDQGIPAVFVVRADGKLLYSESGKPNDMGRFLHRMLKDSGSIPTAETLRKLQKAAVESQQALKRRDYTRALAVAEENGETGSYDAASLTLQRLPEEITTVAIAAANRAETQLSSRKKTVQTAIELAELRRTFDSLPKAKTHIDEVWARLAADDSTKKLLDAAVELDRAAQRADAKEWNEALTIYREVAGANPGSPPGDLAQRQIPIIERQAARAAGGKPAPLPKASPLK